MTEDSAERFEATGWLDSSEFAVIGAGTSGQAAAALLLDLGRKVSIYDDYADPAAAVYAPLAVAGARLVFGKERPLEATVEALVVSPGVATVHRLIEAARERGLPVIGEIELGWRCAPGARVAAITGTNGKTTTTMLLAQLFQDAGWDALAAGNIGLPLCQVVRERGGAGSARLAEAVIALEVSSFQLETTEQFAPEVALVLNVSPDHLDRHRTMEEYAALKGRVTAAQGPEQVLVVNQDDPFCLAIAAGSRARVRRFSLERPVEDGAWLDGDLIMLARPGARPHTLLPMGELKMIGLHNVANAMAAACAADAMGIPRRRIAETLAAFRAAPHRMEPVATIAGVSYVNDSKGTNLGAMERALECFDGGVHLIAGGRDKASPFETVAEKLRGRVRAAYLIGEAAGDMGRAWGDVVECRQCETIERALAEAGAAAAEGDVVLLSPGCASFDQFRSYAHRGEVFMEWVRRRQGELPVAATAPTTAGE